MRIKAVLRDTDILHLDAGSKARIVAAAKKNLERVMNLPSFLKVIGLRFEERCEMLEALKDSEIHVWLLNDGQQHLIYLSEKSESMFGGYNWQ